MLGGHLGPEWGSRRSLLRGQALNLTARTFLEVQPGAEPQTKAIMRVFSRRLASEYNSDIK